MRSLPIRLIHLLRSMIVIGGSLLLAETASAELIASFNARGGSGGGLASGDVGAPGAGFSLQFGSYADGVCLGCSSYLDPMEKVGSFEFNRANAPMFDAFVALLADDRNDILSTYFNRYRSDGTLSGGGGGGNREERLFTVLLTPEVAASIDSVRLTFTLDYQETATGWDAAYVATWQFFGTPGPLFEGPYEVPPKTYPEPNTVPEPATMTMMLAALGVTAVARRRRQAALHALREPA
ncbi:PEP-CTERM sorting domain-containing protein [Steroidobacter cummioxidans]|uniref:PEP-CTERM sorting domain-containing protein n=1 Tax=Steroidobacter cummioxidans TaxID=1803913 RepID=UPI00137B017C|nr:PEP-CTERM sorting domain-containing protein [Steroidobacter cummioxidans]